MGLEHLLENETLPGYVLAVDSVPLVFTQDHNEAFAYWQISGLRQAHVLHVDGHADMKDYVELADQADEDYYEHLTIANMLCAAAHYDIAHSISWLNPHSLSHRLLYLGSKTSDDRFSIRTKVSEYDRIEWEKPSLGHYNLRFGDGKNIKFSELQIGSRPFLLDIDLDAFCCRLPVDNVPSDYYGVDNYGKRIMIMVRLLTTLKKPELISITRSNGRRIFVPSDKVDEVQAVCVAALARLYGTKQDVERLSKEALPTNTTFYGSLE